MMYFMKSPDPSGEFKDAAGCRYSVAAARRIRNSEGVNVGYVPFESLEMALSSWGLSLAPSYAVPENGEEVAP